MTSQFLHTQNILQKYKITLYQNHKLNSLSSAQKHLYPRKISLPMKNKSGPIKVLRKTCPTSIKISQSLKNHHSLSLFFLDLSIIIFFSWFIMQSVRAFLSTHVIFFLRLYFFLLTFLFPLFSHILFIICFITNSINTLVLFYLIHQI